MRTRIAGLDGLRGISAVAVIFCHCAAGSTQIGGIAVGTFFALSGFLVLDILHRGRRRVEAGTRSRAGELASFWGRRAQRILPVYYAVASVALIASVASGALSADDTLYFLAYVQNFFIAWLGHFPTFGYTWTLAVEQQFYVLFAPLMLGVAAVWHRQMLLALWLGLHACVLACLWLGVNTFALFLWPLTGFALAAAGGFFAIEGKASRLAAGLLAPRTVTVFFVAMSLIMLVPNNFATAHRAFNVAQVGLSTIAIPTLVAFVALNPASRATRLLERPIVRFYGSISYSLYLIHGTLVEWIKPHWPALAAGPRQVAFVLERLSLFSVVLALSTILATVTYHTIERRFMGRPPKPESTTPFPAPVTAAACE